MRGNFPGPQKRNNCLTKYTTKMKRMLSCAAVALFATLAQAQNVNYTVKGVVADSVKSVSVLVNEDYKNTSKVDVKNGKFTVNGTADKNAFITVGYNGYGRQGVNVAFVNDGKPVEVNIKDMTVKGSDINNQFGEIQKKTNTSNAKMNALVKEYMAIRQSKEEKDKARRGEIEKEGFEMEKTNFDDLMAYCKAHKSDVTPAYFMRSIADDLEYDELKDLLDTKAAYYNHPMTNYAKRTLASLELRRPGKMYTDFEMNDVNGKPHKLSEWAGKGNYVLVDFWASWCGPCRAEMPNVVETYKKYHSKGYEVVGVSFDNQLNAWKAAIEKLGLTWPHISDLKGWKSLASDLYGIKAIPANILLDGTGKIVAIDLRGDALQNKLKEIYGF